MLQGTTKSGKQYSQTYIRTIRSQFTAIMNYAVRLHGLPFNPLDKAEYYYAFEVLYWTGMRMGEMLALRLGDIDFDNLTIKVDETYTRLKKKDLITSPKTKDSKRIIHIPKNLADELREYVGGIYGLEKESRIFNVSKYGLHREIDRAVKSCGLPDICVHGLRHSCASFLQSEELKIPEVVVSAILGHSNTRCLKMVNNGLNISLKSYDSIFQSEEQRNTEEIKPVPISELKPFTEQPFKVKLDDDMDALVESIKQCGVLTPVIARPHKDGGYEILSGHRRVKACELAGITDIPVVVKNLDDDTATILLVDSNLQREHILPSEKAFAYQMKLEAMKRKAGRPSKENPRQIVGNLESADILGQDTGESGRQIQRYIRLTNLIDPILDMVDNNQIAMNAAVEISYLSSKEQAAVMQSIEKEETSPSIAQARKMRKFHQEGNLSNAVIDSIMMEQKPETVKITLGEEKLKKYFPKSYSKAKMEEIILKLLDKWRRQRENEMER